MAQIDKPNLHFNTVFYTGNNTSQSVTGVGFQPDWVWLKERNGTEAHNLYDSVRGIYKRLSSNTTDAEYSSATQLTSFDSDGFSVGSSDAINDTGNTMVGWNWKAGGTASSNTDGSITSSVSASTTSGFSVVSYTGTGAVATVGHGLGVEPSMIIFKNRDTTNSWNVYHTALGNGKFIRLNDTGAEGNTGRFNNTSPTSSVFSLGVNGATAVNGDGNSIIAYCFANKAGFSKFGSYVGNGNADGTFIYTGFKPAFVIVKASSRTGRWRIYDNKINPFNVADTRLSAEGADAESTGTTNAIDIVSNGFKIRTSEGQFNGSGETNIYMCFAESPIVGSNSVPTTAR